MVLDTYEFASEELKARLAGPRSSEAAVEEEADQASKRQKREAVGTLMPCITAVELTPPVLLRWCDVPWVLRAWLLLFDLSRLLVLAKPQHTEAAATAS